ncbi:hypothetical protein AB9E26_37285, partial [Rhizobium leguminosarum]
VSFTPPLAAICSKLVPFHATYECLYSALAFSWSATKGACIEPIAPISISYTAPQSIMQLLAVARKKGDGEVAKLGP